ncbi:MAG: T9SS type A sorting domain-containing protein [candidate division Zixibacteria bacterium]|nr:T9SS type A sorting domain-containing protein [Candidatus Tariuqbacter arcticus]
MKKFTLILLAALLFASMAVAADYVALNSADEPFTAQALESDGNRTLMKYSVNGYAADEIMIDGETYTLLQKLRKESIIEEKGYPRLPRINRSIIIPDNGIMGYNVISSEYIEITDIDIAPSKGHILRTIDPATVPYTFGKVYQKDAFFPAELVNLRQPYVMRDVRGLVVELNCFQYNPVTRTLRIYTDVTVEVKRIAPGGENVLTRSQPLTKMMPQFSKTYQRHFINYDPLDYPIQLEEGDLLIICYDDFLDLLDPLVEWKNQRGIPTTLVAISEIGANTTAIYNYIRDMYLTANLGYVLIVGDHQQVPTYSSGSDPKYGMLVGSDAYTEVFVGRFSAETRAQAQTQVDRTLDYEIFPQEGAVWYHKGLGIASNQGPGHHGEYDDEHITLIANKLIRYTYTQVDSVYDNWGTQNMIYNSLNEGRGIINYCGHGSTTSWGTTGFNNGDVDDLVNSNMLPFIITVACVNGSFTGTTCFAEAWLRATNNATGEPTGAIGMYASKISQSWNPPMDAQDEAVDLMVADSMFTYGGYCFNGGMLMVDLNGTTGENEMRNWTIFGDPSLFLRNDTPQEYTATHDPVLFLGTSTFEVTVMNPNGAVEGAMVCGMNDEIYAVGTTDPSGQVTLEFDPGPAQPGEFTLTVTGWNAIPYITELDIIPPSGPYVVYEDHTIQDDLTGNNNGQLDYAETVELGMTVENVGVAVASGVTGTLSTDDPLITITQNTADLGDIPANTTAYIDRAFEFEIVPEVEDGHPVVFLLTAADGIDVWESNFTIIAHAPDVIFSNLTIDDVAGGNGNGGLDPGETADLLVTFLNDGSSTTAGVIADLSTTDPYIIINLGSWAIWEALPPGGEVEGLFNITVSPDCPQEHLVDFLIDVSDGAGYAGLTGFSTVVGDILYNPTGPDNYGYIAYDIHDAPLMPTYEWVELSPDSGGPGTQIPFTNDDQVLHYALPFTFQYYGLEYDSITIATNGWVGMGIITEEDYSNSGIPDSDGPAPMIATYWEDLSPQRPNSGGVWYWYDEANNRYIVEYNNVEQFAPTGNFETFQAILLDPAYYTTSTGDGQIIFQYKEMSLASQEEGTIGIENHSETDGIQYLYDGAYDIYAAPAVSGMAVLYTTPIEAPEVTITLTPAVTPVVIPAIGGSFDYNLEIANTGTSTIFFDGWLDVMFPDSTVYGPLLLRENMTLSPSGVITRAMNQNVPGYIPAGIYNYFGKVGNHPDIIFDSDSFPFEKLPGDGSNSPYGEWTLTGWDEEPAGILALTPDTWFLSQNYPNPFNPETNISFAIAETGEVSLKVYNLLGEVAAVIVEGNLSAGYYQYKWNASNLASGIYFYRLEAQGFTAVKKMMLVR